MFADGTHRCKAMPHIHSMMKMSKYAKCLRDVRFLAEYVQVVLALRSLSKSSDSIANTLSS